MGRQWRCCRGDSNRTQELRSRRGSAAWAAGATQALGPWALAGFSLAASAVAWHWSVSESSLFWSPALDDPEQLDALNHSCCRATGSGAAGPMLIEGPCNDSAICVMGTNRLGNNIKALERAFWLAHQRNFCWVLLRSVKPDVSSFVDVNPMGAYHGLLQLAPRVPPLNKTEVGRKCEATCQTDMCYVQGVKYPTVQVFRHVSQQFLLPRLRCQAFSQNPLPADVVVMHLRGGDVLYGLTRGKGKKADEEKVRWKGHYPQPPCSFWLTVLEYGNQGQPFAHALVVMEPGYQHPCVQYLVNKTSTARIKVQSTRVAKDACTMVLAQHLAIGFGTWGVQLARLNRHLLGLHVPFADDGLSLWEYQSYHIERHWFRNDVVYETGSTYAQYVYSFPGFQSNQSLYVEKRQALLEYSASSIVKRSIPCSCRED